VKAAIVTAPGKTPVYGEFDKPVARDGEEIILVKAAALSNLTKSRASGAHYSSAGVFPAVAGTDGVGLTQDGRRVYFAMPEAPFGSLTSMPGVVSTFPTVWITSPLPPSRTQVCRHGLRSLNAAVLSLEKRCL